MSKHNRVWHIPASSWTLQKNQASYMSICINATHMLWLVLGPQGQSKAQIGGGVGAGGGAGELSQFSPAPQPGRCK